MQVSQSIAEGKATLSLTGRFDFNTHREFRTHYESALDSPDIKTLDIDMSGVDYLDSSALGMLLMLRERADARNIKISLSNTTDTVKQILHIANFNKLFAVT